MISKTKKNKTHSMGRVKYDLHFTVSGFSILFLDLIFNIKTYGAVDYRVLLENDVSSAYLTKKGQAQAFKLSEKLLKDAFFEKIFSDSELLNKKLQAHRVS